MHYVYVIQSLKDKRFYTGFTENLERRIGEHNRGREPSTKSRAPFKLIYFEACLSKNDAIAREKQLKSGKGKKYLKIRIRHYLEDLE